MSDALHSTRLWKEAEAVPAALRRTVSTAEGFADLAALIGAPDVERLVVSGNGAAYYVALALWLASLEGSAAGPPVIAVPAGLLARGRFPWRAGDRLLAVSSSGEMRDLVEALEAGAPRPYGAITSTPTSQIASGAAATAVVFVRSQEAMTHTQAFCGNLAAALAVWARVTADHALWDAVMAAPDATAEALTRAVSWVGGAVERLDRPSAAVCFGSGPAWVAALEAALLLKEVARIPTEGTETREGATSAMYCLEPGQLVVSIPTGNDEILAEAEATCSAAGASVVRLDGGGLSDPRLAAITTFPAALALAGELGLESGLDIDNPSWRDAYLATARTTDKDIS